MKKQTSQLFGIIVISVAILSLAGVLVYGGMHGWFGFTFNEAPKTPLPDQIPPDKELYTYNARISITPASICSGDTVSGVITSNIYNGYCSIFMSNGGALTFITALDLDANGYHQENQRVDVVGDATFIAVCCDENENCKQTNWATLTSRVCDCTDSDGGDFKDLVGHATSGGLQYYDKCTEGLNLDEYVCIGGVPTIKKEVCDSNEICMETRSGGHCIPNPNSYTCTDSDGGKTYNTWGNCQSSFESVGYQDTCTSGISLNEYYCDSNNICQKEVHQCDPSNLCRNGKCINQAQDTDGDGYTDVEEIDAGTNPKDPLDHPINNQHDEVCNDYCGSKGFGMFEFLGVSSPNECNNKAFNKCLLFKLPVLNFEYEITNGCCCWTCGA